MKRRTAVRILRTRLLGEGEKMREAKDMAIKALELIPDNATNGDVIEAILGENGRIGWNSNDMFLVKDTHILATFDKIWWNAPYEGGNKMEKNND